MSTGLLFITAHCDFKVANRILLELRDLEYKSGDRQHVVLSRSATDLNQTGNRSILPETVAGSLTKETFDDVNGWAGATLKEVEDFILAEAQKSEKKDEPSLFLVLDEEGISKQNIIITERNLALSDDEEDGGYGNYEFNKARFPWDEAYGVWANLDISNVGFDELCDGEPDENGWWSALDKKVSGVVTRDSDELRERRKLTENFVNDGKM